MSEQQLNTDTAETLIETFVLKATEIIGNIVNNTFKQPVNTNASLNLNASLNETEKFKATPEGLFLAYSSLVILALIPIILGSFKSVIHQKSQHVNIKSYFFLIRIINRNRSSFYF
jgi:hypothetical protein